MSVYIKGMEMPKVPTRVIIFADGRVEDEDDSAYKYSAIPVPDHGRLIDADKLGIREQEKQAYEVYLQEKSEFFIEEPIIEYHRGYLEGLTHASGHVRFAPTIIPASEEDRECEYVTPPQTRGDSIRAKSDEKLANFLVECCGCPPDLVDREYCGTVGCLKCWLNWLQKEC